MRALNRILTFDHAHMKLLACILTILALARHAVLQNTYCRSLWSYCTLQDTYIVPMDCRRICGNGNWTDYYAAQSDSAPT